MLQRSEDGYGQVKLADGTVIRAQLSHALDGGARAVTVAIRPERIGIYTPLNPPKALGGGIDISDVTVLDAVLADSQYIGTDTRYTLALGDEIELVARLQNVKDRDGAAFSKRAARQGLLG